MTLRTRGDANAPATLTDEQRRRVADALERARSENTRRNYAGQLRRFRAWCERGNYRPIPAFPEMVAAYAAELADEGRSVSTIRLPVAAIADAHRRAGLESPVNAVVSETLRGPGETGGRRPEAGEAARRRRAGGDQGDSVHAEKVAGRVA